MINADKLKIGDIKQNFKPKNAYLKLYKAVLPWYNKTIIHIMGEKYGFIFFPDVKEDGILRILGIDPGYAIVGYGVVEYSGGRFTPLDFGAVTTEADTLFERRLQQVYDGVTAVIEKNKPDALSIEQLFYQSNQRTVIFVAEARGVILLAAQQHGVPVFEYTPLQVKQAVTGYGKAVKKQVQEMTRKILRLEKVPKPDDTADALAMAICHGHCARSILFKQNISPR